VTLKLAMIRCPDNVAPQRREVRGGEFSIGRGPDNEWVIADPDRHLSKRHCLLVHDAGEWGLQDLSTNGTFLNQSSEPIGRGTHQKLRSGDRIKFGLYELEVTIEEDEDALSGSLGLRSSHPFGERPSDEAAPFLDPPGSVRLPPDYDPLTDSSDPFAREGTQPDHAPALDSAFRMPPMAIIPDDWDAEPSAVKRPPPSEPVEPPRPRPEAAPPPPSPPPRSPANQQAANHQSANHQAANHQGENHRAAVPQAAPPQPVSRAPSAADDARLAKAFLRGAGLGETTLKDPEKTLERIGEALRATVSGLRQTLIARASIKDEFRIEQTLLRPAGNNPLKFSLDDDDALATLLGEGRRGSMVAEAAIAEAFADLRVHELATISAMQAAVRVLLAQCAPDVIESKVATSALHIHPVQRRAAAWDAFVQHHRVITQALSDDFDSVFGKAFARAYEEAIEKLEADDSFNTDRGTS